MNRIRIQAVTLAVVMMLSVIAFAIPGGAFAAADGEIETQSGDDVEIDSAISEASGEKTFFLDLEEPERIETADFGELTPEAMQSAVADSQANVEAAASELDGVTVERTYWITNEVLVTVDLDRVDPEQDLATIDGVEAMLPNEKIELVEPPTDEELDDEALEVGETLEADDYTYGLEHVNVPDVWDDFDVRGDGATVAVLDTGIDPDHPDIDLAEDGWNEWDRHGEEVDSNPYDLHGHGTHVAGTAIGGNASGTAIGVAPDADLIAAPVLPDGSGFRSQILAGIEWAIEENADVINMSLGSSDYASEYIEPIRNAHAAGTAVVSSAGNSGPDTSGSPANVYDAFSIGASDEFGAIADFSSGEKIKTSEAWGGAQPSDWPLYYTVPDVSAPGVFVESAYPTHAVDDDEDAYEYMSGTSMASPHVAGAMALIVSEHDDMDVEDAMDILEETAAHPDGPDAKQDTRYGHGIVDVYAAMIVAESDTSVEGTVTLDGEPVEGVFVDADNGTSTVTDADGEYELDVRPGEVTVAVDDFGLGAAETVTVDEDETETVDLELERFVDATVLQDQPLYAESGESFEIAVEVANLENYTVELGDDSTLDEENVTVELGETELEFGESVDFDEPVTDTVVLSVTTNETAEGELQLEHTFAGPGEDVEETTGPTFVVEELDDADFEIVHYWAEESAEYLGAFEQDIVIENTGQQTGLMELTYEVYKDDELVDETELGVLEVPAGFAIVQEGWLFGAFEDRFVEGPGTYDHGFVVSDPVTGEEYDSEYREIEITEPRQAVVIDEYDAPEDIDAGDDLEITATLNNTEDRVNKERMSFWLDETYVDDLQVTLDPEEEKNVTIEFSGKQTADMPDGVYHHVLVGWWDQAEGSFAVGMGEFAPYVDDDGVVDTDGLRLAIDDWRAGEIETDFLREVIDHWRSGEPVGSSTAADSPTSVHGSPVAVGA